MRFQLVFLNAVDPLLGRLDYASLSEEAVMEMVIEGITNKEKICGDVEEWKGVTIEKGEVVALEESGIGVGSFGYTYPAHLDGSDVQCLFR